MEEEAMELEYPEKSDELEQEIKKLKYLQLGLFYKHERSLVEYFNINAPEFVDKITESISTDIISIKDCKESFIEILNIKLEDNEELKNNLIEIINKRCSLKGIEDDFNKFLSQQDDKVKLLLINTFFECKGNFIDKIFSKMRSGELTLPNIKPCTRKWTLFNRNRDVISYFGNNIMKKQFRVGCDAEGKIYLGNSQDNKPEDEKKYIYIVKENAEIYCLPEHISKYKHTSHNFEDVVAAGEIMFNNGIIIKISHNSGHYMPGPSSIRKFAVALKKRIGKKAEIHKDAKCYIFCETGGKHTQAFTQKFWENTLSGNATAYTYAFK